MQNKDSGNHFSNVGVEIDLAKDDCFLTIKETLTRIGIESKRDMTLYQSCHILHKRGRYAIVHFKELFALDGNDTDLNDTDVSRRNKIVTLLVEWGLVKINDSRIESKLEPLEDISHIKIIPHKNKKDWKLQPKYKIGKK